MYIDFSSIFHQSSKDLSDKGTVRIPRNDSEWPEDWKTVYYKTYPRFPKIALKRTEPHADFFKVINSRRTRRSFSGKPVDLTEFSALLQYSMGITHTTDDGTSARSYASGGARYPIEVYPIVFKGSKEIPSGLYHYGAKKHELELLWQRPFTAEDISKLFVYDWVQKASFALVLTVTFRRSQNKYGERGYRYVLLETGHLSENVYLCAEALGFSCCAMTGLWDTNIEKLLDIDGITESVVHSLILG